MKRAITAFLCVILFAAPLLPQEIVNAVDAGDMDKVKALLEENPEIISTKDEYKNSLLCRALLRNNFAIARLLIEKGIDVNYIRMDTGTNDLYAAISVGSLEITKLLADKGADINLNSDRGTSPLGAAIREGQKDIAYFLMDRGAVLNAEVLGVMETMRSALSGGLDRIVNLLLKDYDVDFLAKSGMGSTLLHSAANGGETDFIGLFIEKGVDPDAKNVYGWAPLHYAALKGHRDTIAALIKNGAEKNIRTKDGKTPYNVARETGQEDLLPWLEEMGFDKGPQQFPKISAKYIDPELPDSRPRYFALGIISQLYHFEHSRFNFTRDMQTVCWADWNRGGISKIFVMERKNGLWQAPQTVYLQATNPFMTNDGKRIYFTAMRTLSDGKEARDNDIYYIQKTGTGWSEPIDVGPNINTDTYEGQPTVTDDGTIYFAHDADIYRSRLVNGKYQPKEKLPAPINTDTSQSEPTISGDESYMIYRSLGEGGMMVPNFYISFRDGDGSWSEPVNIAAKVSRIGLFPSITPDNKYMIYFEGGEYFWFDISAVLADVLKNRQGGHPPGRTLFKIQDFTR